MSEGSLLTESAPSAEQTATEICDVCGRENAGGSLPEQDLPAELKSIVAANAPDGDLAQVCANCVALFTRAQRQLAAHAAVFEQTSYVLPTPLRLDADERFTGKG